MTPARPPEGAHAVAPRHERAPERTAPLPPTVYLDHNATTPPLPEAVAETIDVLQRAWANPSSLHASGQAARRVLADARLRVARFLGCQPAELVFTSGATEANHMALLGALSAQRAAGRHGLVVSAVEHPGLLALAERLRGEGTPLQLIPVDPQGRLDMAVAQSLVGRDTALVSVMAANNETGVLMPTVALATLAHGQGALLHVDATQLAGKGALSFDDCGADLMSVSAHKFGGPKGVGALVVRKGVVLPPLLVGRQERHRRGGTENMPGIAGFAAACDHAACTLPADVERLRALRQRLEDGLRAALPRVQILGRQAERLCNTSCVQFGTLDAELVLARLERAGVFASSGAACSAGGTQPSHVLMAMGCTEVQARAGVRFSLGAGTRADEIDHAIEAARASLGPLLLADRLAA
jgi:cysteine desulfurase